MDYNRESEFGSGNAVHVIPNEIWASEDEYRVWNDNETPLEAPSNSNYDSRQSQTRSGSEPPNKKSRNTSSSSTLDSGTSSRSKAIGKMFFKTKLCCKYRAGTCPYVTNCNFAHSIEELRRPPPNWQEIVAAHEEEKSCGGGFNSSVEPREEFQIPSIGSSSFGGESQRSYKGRHCKKFYTDEGCPYGDNCTFLHDEQSKNRESVAISLGPGGYSGGGGGGGGSGGGGGGRDGGGGGVGGGGVGVGGGGGGGSSGGSGGAGAGGNGSNVKPSNWKTRICNKWELTRYCPFGNKCHFAHGSAELHRYGGGLVEQDGRDSSAASSESKQGGVPSKTPADTVVASVNTVTHSDVYLGVPSQRSTIVIQRPGQRAHQKWKGPDKISRIYGDWIDDIE